ncbi:hypothetical protein EST38_g7499 [Candolleomyces aberdarensis]|uniref:Uncharacterized protein n=1 Tax=Candolleomyces aberdarensis TaxID=2316362 RepID=A0A4Q2DGZ0_9AGAR|nr:hypothetical protein EST38_g7499 [Candolleomyces aberdarensis]
MAGTSKQIVTIEVTPSTRMTRNHADWLIVLKEAATILKRRGVPDTPEP